MVPHFIGVSYVIDPPEFKSEVSFVIFFYDLRNPDFRNFFEITTIIRDYTCFVCNRPSWVHFRSQFLQNFYELRHNYEITIFGNIDLITTFVRELAFFGCNRPFWVQIWSQFHPIYDEWCHNSKKIDFFRKIFVSFFIKKGYF